VEATPWWYQPNHIANQVWIWSEFIVMMTNQKRRALLDFIAGTVVLVWLRVEVGKRGGIPSAVDARPAIDGVAQ